MPDMMEIEVLFFAGIAEATGMRRTVLAVDEGITVGKLIDQLCERHPEAAPADSPVGRFPQSGVRLRRSNRPARGRNRPHPPGQRRGRGGRRAVFRHGKPLSADRMIRLVSNPRPAPSSPSSARCGSGRKASEPFTWSTRRISRWPKRK